MLNPGETLFFGGCSPDRKTYMTRAGEIIEVEEFFINHKEADSRIFCHAKWSGKQAFKIVAADTDIFLILLLNFHHFSQKTMLIDQSDQSQLLHVNALVEAMNQDQDSDIVLLKQRNYSSPHWLGHPC